MEVFAPIFWPFWPSWSSYEKMSFYNILALQIIGAVCRINLFDPVHRKQMVVFVITFWPSWPYSLAFFWPSWSSYEDHIILALLIIECFPVHKNKWGI